MTSDEAQKGRGFDSSTCLSGTGSAVSTPSYPEEQVFCTHLVSSIEAANPDFAWVQFLFVRSTTAQRWSGSRTRCTGPRYLSSSRPLTWSAGSSGTGGSFIATSTGRPARMKKVNDIASKPASRWRFRACGWLISTQSPSAPSPLTIAPMSMTPAIFQVPRPQDAAGTYRQEDGRGHNQVLGRYTGSRLEPPSFIVTPEELKS